MPIEVRVDDEGMQDEVVLDEDDEQPVVMVRHRTTSSSENERQHAFAALQVVGGMNSGRPPKASPSSSMSSDHQSDSAGSVPLSVKTSSEGSNFQVPHDAMSPRVSDEPAQGPVIWDNNATSVDEPAVPNTATTDSQMNTNTVEQNMDEIPFADPENMFEDTSKHSFLLEDVDQPHWDRMRDRMRADSGEEAKGSESPPHPLPNSDANHFGAWSRRWAAEPADTRPFPEIRVDSGPPPRPAPTLPDFSDVLTFHRIDSAQVLCMDARKPPKIIGHYLFGARLGEGSYGKVKECLDTDTLCRRAVKIMKHDKIRKIPNGFDHVEFEIKQLKRLKHDNVIRLYDVIRNEKKIYLVMEYCVASLQGVLDNAPAHRLELWQCQTYFVQLMNGLQYLHGQGVVHKDIKPGNLLLNPAEQLKITDFGTSDRLKVYDDSDIVEQGVGTPKFQPPEIAGAKDGSPLRGFPIDMWACGVTLYNMVSGEWPFDGTNEFMVYNNISALPVVLPACIEHEETLAKLILGLLNKNPKERVTIRQVRLCDWFRRRLPRTSRCVGLPATDHYPLSVYPCLEQLYGSQVHSPVGSHPSNELLAAPSYGNFFPPGGHARRKLTTGSQFEGDALTFSVNRGFSDEDLRPKSRSPDIQPELLSTHPLSSECRLSPGPERSGPDVQMSSASSSTTKLSTKRNKFCKQQ